MNRDSAARRSGGKGQHVFGRRRCEDFNPRAGSRKEFGFPGGGLCAARDDDALALKGEKCGKARQRPHTGRTKLERRTAHAVTLGIHEQIEFSPSRSNTAQQEWNRAVLIWLIIEDSSNRLHSRSGFGSSTPNLICIQGACQGPSRPKPKTWRASGGIAPDALRYKSASL